MFYFHILDLNVNEWIPVKGCIEVVPSNSVSMSSCDIVVYWGYGQGPYVVITTSVETMDGLWLYRLYVG